MVILVQASGGAVTIRREVFQQELALGRMGPEVLASIDGGRSWLPARQLDGRLRARGDDGLAFVLPMRVEAWSTVAGHIALFSFLFFGGPISIVAVVAGFDSGSNKLVRFGFILAAILLGPTPIALAAALGRRALVRDPTLRGKGRMIFAFVIASILTIPCLIGLFGALLR